MNRKRYLDKVARAMRRGEKQLSAADYGAVVRLRKAGHEVRRLPGLSDRHLLDGEIVPTSWLVDMARDVDQPRIVAVLSPTD